MINCLETKLAAGKLGVDCPHRLDGYGRGQDG